MAHAYDLSTLGCIGRQISVSSRLIYKVNPRQSRLHRERQSRKEKKKKKSPKQKSKQKTSKTLPQKSKIKISHSQTNKTNPWSFVCVIQLLVNMGPTLKCNCPWHSIEKNLIFSYARENWLQLISWLRRGHCVYTFLSLCALILSHMNLTYTGLVRNAWVCVSYYVHLSCYVWKLKFPGSYLLKSFHFLFHMICEHWQERLDEDTLFRIEYSKSLILFMLSKSGSLC